MFDGVTAGGCVNAHAAQAFASYTLRWLAAHKKRLHQLETDRLRQEFENLFTHCISCKNNPGKARQAEGGSATGVVASCYRTARGRLSLVGATIGDASAIIIDPDGTSRIISRYKRSDATAKDTGGQLTMCMGVHGDVNVFSQPLTNQSVIILTTDGFTDNILKTDFANIINTVLRAPFFDHGPEKARRGSLGNPANLPAHSELLALVGPLESLDLVTCQSMVLRISNYLKWVTMSLFEREQLFFELQISMREKTEELLAKQKAAKRIRESQAAHGAATGTEQRPAGHEEQGATQAKQQMKEPTADGQSSGDGNESEAGEKEAGEREAGEVGEEGAAEAQLQQLDKDVKVLEEQIRVISGECDELQRKRKEERFAGKTDDALVVAMRPVWQ